MGTQLLSGFVPFRRERAARKQVPFAKSSQTNVVGRRRLTMNRSEAAMLARVVFVAAPLQQSHYAIARTLAQAAYKRLHRMGTKLFAAVGVIDRLMSIY